YCADPGTELAGHDGSAACPVHTGSGRSRCDASRFQRQDRRRDQFGQRNEGCLRASRDVAATVTRRGGPADAGSAGMTSPAGEPTAGGSASAESAGGQAAGASAAARSVAAGMGRAALLIGGVTIIARILGFARTVVFAGTVKTSCLSTAYVTANLVPNVIYDIVLGGALTAIVVPILAGPAHRAASAPDPGAEPEVSRISSAVLTWTVVILAPVSIAVAA